MRFAKVPQFDEITSREDFSGETQAQHTFIVLPEGISEDEAVEIVCNWFALQIDFKVSLSPLDRIELMKGLVKDSANSTTFDKGQKASARRNLEYKDGRWMLRLKRDIAPERIRRCVENAEIAVLATRQQVFGRA